MFNDVPFGVDSIDCIDDNMYIYIYNIYIYIMLECFTCIANPQHDGSYNFPINLPKISYVYPRSSLKGSGEVEIWRLPWRLYDCEHLLTPRDFKAGDRRKVSRGSGFRVFRICWLN